MSSSSSQWRNLQGGRSLLVWLLLLLLPLEVLLLEMGVVLIRRHRGCRVRMNFRALLLLRLLLLLLVSKSIVGRGAQIQHSPTSGRLGQIRQLLLLLVMMVVALLL